MLFLNPKAANNPTIGINGNIKIASPAMIRAT
jgi:hypothetical protein